MDDPSLWNEAYREDADGVMVQDRLLASATAGLSVGSALDLGCGCGTIGRQKH